MPHLSRIDDTASITSSAAGLTRAERLENRQRLAAAAQALILVKNPTEVSSPLSAGWSPGVRRRGRLSPALSKLNEDDDESEDDLQADFNAAADNNDNAGEVDNDEDNDDNDDNANEDDRSGAHDDAHDENPYLAFRARKIARNERKLRDLGLSVPSHASSDTVINVVVDMNGSIDNNRHEEDYVDHKDDKEDDDDDLDEDVAAYQLVG